MRVLVTGDRGYIGAVLVPMLLKAGHEVVGLDIEFFKKSFEKTFDYLKITKDIRKVTKQDLNGIDAVIHLAALSNDPMGAINSKLTRDINLKASIRLARLSKQVGVKRFLFSSSCSIYGIAGGTVTEKSKVNPQTAYAESKIKVEDALKKLADKSFCVGILRNSTVYGYSPRFRNDLVVNNFVTCALALGKIKVMSDGSPWRPLIDVRDLSRIFIEFLTVDGKKINGKIFNIGFNENNFRVKDVLKSVKSNLPTCEVVFTGEHGADTRSYKVSFDTFNKLFPKFKKKWPLNKSVINLIECLKRVKYSKSDFEKQRYTRLAVLQELIKTKKIDKNLFII